jgi:hypothetical protein
MPEISDNIQYDKSIIQSDDSKFYTKQLEIVSLNLDDFNQRFNSDIVLKFDHHYNSFYLVSPNEPYRGDMFIKHISHLLGYYNNREFIEETNFINNDLRIINNVARGFINVILFDNSDYKKSDEFQTDLNNFLTRYENYCPLGILTEKGEKHFRNYLTEIYNRVLSAKSQL